MVPVAGGGVGRVGDVAVPGGRGVPGDGLASPGVDEVPGDIDGDALGLLRA
jgi:hypothetical protein